jgi:alpha-beta hydrolase superfamily lysophospholipase
VWSDGKDSLVGHRNTREFLHQLSDKLQASVLAWDYPGHGESTDVPFDEFKSLQRALQQGIDAMVQVLTRDGWEYDEIILGCRCMGCLAASWIASPDSKLRRRCMRE